MFALIQLKYNILWTERVNKNVNTKSCIINQSNFSICIQQRLRYALPNATIRDETCSI